ncbi:MAG: Tim44 domain-containing protein [Thermodesulfobacteriota bacterium]
MLTTMNRLTSFFLLFLGLMLIEGGISTDYADARSRSGGRSFTRSAPVQKTPTTTQQATTAQKPGFGKALAGGLLGGAIGAMLFGSLFGMGGSGFGILPLILLAVGGYFLYRRFAGKPASAGMAGYQPPPPPAGFDAFPSAQAGTTTDLGRKEQGLAMIRQTDPGFDEKHFVEVASDVFFQIQAGWMRRDLSSYRHLLGDELAAQYEGHFEEMREKGEINKLENISIRTVEIIDAGKQQNEDFVTILFTANLLDYTVNDTSGELIVGSMTQPVKFAEAWTWARPAGTENWRLEGIREVNG